MMRLLDVSGYTSMRDPKWEDALRKARGNEYFYEHRDFVHSGNVTYLKGVHAGKVMISGLLQLPPPIVKVIWMDRRRASVLASQASYNRAKMINRSLEEDYDNHDVDRILSDFDHIRVQYEELLEFPEWTLRRIHKFVPLAPMDVLTAEIDPSRKHF